MSWLRYNFLSLAKPMMYEFSLLAGVRRSAFLLAVLLLPWTPLDLAATTADSSDTVGHVILISVDGLRPDAITKHDPDELPNFYRLRAEGAFTDNARTDADYSVTLPNHMAQLTGRPVLGEHGHSWNMNGDPGAEETLHSHRNEYVHSVFDVASNAGLRTGSYVSKSKFVLLEESYDQDSGAPDRTPPNDGRDKIDYFVYEKDTDDLVKRYVRDMQDVPFEFSFVHLRDPDSKGHVWGWRTWKWSPYMASVRKADRLLGEIMDLVERDPELAGNTVIILTADHGGSGHGHGDAVPENYTVPFYVWGAGVEAGDLYAMNADSRRDPGTAHPGFDEGPQPIRNGGAANLALDLLGLGPVPGSTINEEVQLRVRKVSAPPQSASPYAATSSE